MSEGQLVMILVVEHIEEIPVEWMDVLYFWEIIKDVNQFLIDGVLAKLNLKSSRLLPFSCKMI